MVRIHLQHGHSGAPLAYCRFVVFSRASGLPGCFIGHGWVAWLEAQWAGRCASDGEIRPDGRAVVRLYAVVRRARCFCVSGHVP